MGSPARPLIVNGRARQGVRIVLLVALVLIAVRGRAQNVTEPSLKAAFIYNVAKFTVWPADVLPTTATVVACVVGDAAVREALERTVKDRQLSGHSIRVLQVSPGGPWQSCHLLYISAVPAPQVLTILAAVRVEPVLTVSDLDDFVRQGGIVQLFIENARMRFDLNLDVVKRSRLQLSSKLLVLAAHVLDMNQEKDR